MAPGSGRGSRLQQTGRQAQARIVESRFSDINDVLLMDISSAYDVKGLEKMQRAFVYSRQGSGSLTITDEIHLNGPQTLETALITFSKVEQQGQDLLRVSDQEVSVQVRSTQRAILQGHDRDPGRRLHRRQEACPCGHTPHGSRVRCPHQHPDRASLI